MTARYHARCPVEPVILEDESRTGPDKPIQGQAVEYPVVINGRIGRVRELHFDVFFPRLVGTDDLAGGEMLLYLYD